MNVRCTAGDGIVQQAVDKAYRGFVLGQLLYPVQAEFRLLGFEFRQVERADRAVVLADGALDLVALGEDGLDLLAGDKAQQVQEFMVGRRGRGHYQAFMFDQKWHDPVYPGQVLWNQLQGGSVDVESVQVDPGDVQLLNQCLGQLGALDQVALQENLPELAAVGALLLLLQGQLQLLGVELSGVDQ